MKVLLALLTLAAIISTGFALVGLAGTWTFERHIRLIQAVIVLTPVTALDVACVLLWKWRPQP